MALSECNELKIDVTDHQKIVAIGAPGKYLLIEMLWKLESGQWVSDGCVTLTAEQTLRLSNFLKEEAAKLSN